MANNNVIIALDFPTKVDCFNFLEQFNVLEEKPFVKVGMELYYKEGIEFVKSLKDAGFKVFLDLKLFDIPQTVYNAIYNILKNVDVDIINVHGLGGKEMMSQALQAKIDANSNTKLIAVTLLTSFSDQILQDDFSINTPFYTLFENLVNLTHDAKLDGIVCSSKDLETYKHSDENFIYVTPGVRTLEDNANDQKRVVTPSIAKRNGSTYIVVGRPITKDVNPVAKYRRILTEFN